MPKSNEGSPEPAGPAGTAAHSTSLSQCLSELCDTTHESFCYSICPPTWTSNGLYSLNTRPDLAVHRRNYDTCPRLFPVHTYAEQLCKPYPPLRRKHYVAEFHAPRVISGTRTKVLPDGFHPLLPTSPGVSDIETDELPKRRKRNRPDNTVFDGDFSQIMLNAEWAMSQARHTQRHSWRCSSRYTSLPAIGLSNDLLDTWANENILCGSEKSAEQCSVDSHGAYYREASSGNPLSVIRMGDENLLICALSGSLDSVGLFGLSVSNDATGSLRTRLLRKGTCEPCPDSIYYNTEPVIDIVATNWESGSSEPAKLLATTPTTLNFADVYIDHQRPAVDWENQLSFPSVLSCALNPLFPAEFAAISPDGMFVGSPQEYLSRQGDGDQGLGDVQVLSKQQLYNWVYYGPHPRSLLLASRMEVAMMDARKALGRDSGNVLFDVRKDWNLPHHDSGIAVITPLRPRSQTMFVATQTALNFFDLRMPRSPLLDWSMSVPLSVEQCGVTSVTSHGKHSEIVALSSPKQCYFEVFHAIHDVGVNTASLTSQMLEGKKSDRHPPALASRSLLWSDLPLTHLQQVKGVSQAFGMAICPLSDETRVSILQWSKDYGLIGQLLDVRPAQDEEASKPSFEDGREAGGDFVGTSLSMHHFQRRRLEHGGYASKPWMQRPVHMSMPGGLLQQRTKRVYLSDAWEIRPCILRDDDDDVDDTGFIRLPRPFLGDIPVVVSIRYCSGSANSDATISPNAMKTEAAEIWSSDLMSKHPEKSPTASTDGEGLSLGIVDDTHQRSVLKQHTGVKQFLDGKGQSLPSGGDVPEQKSDMSIDLARPSEWELFQEGMEDDGAMNGLLEDIGSGKTLDEIGRLIRRGIGHNATPLGVAELQSTVEAAPIVGSYDVEWHSMCAEDHSNCPTAVSTNELIPNWVHTRVYYTEEVEAGRALELSNVDEESGYGKLLLRMKHLFSEGYERV